MKTLAINQADDKTAEILLYDFIGQTWDGLGTSAKGLLESLNELNGVETINVRINSPGGLVHEAKAIYNALVRHPARVVVDIDGLAASAASWIAMAGDEIRMASNALLMMHEAQGFTMGGPEDHRKQAELLDTESAIIAKTYAARAGRRENTFRKLMQAETWMTADEAKEAKLVDTITGQKRVAACLDPRILNSYQKPPEQLQAFVLDEQPPRNDADDDPPQVPTEEEIAARKDAVTARLRVLALDEE